MDPILDQIFLYKPTGLVSYVLPATIVAALFSPRLLLFLVIAVNLLRPNERFLLPFSYTILLYCVVILALAVRWSTLRQFPWLIEDKVLTFLFAFIILNSILLHRYNLQDNILFCVSGLLYYVSIVFLSSYPKGFFVLHASILLSCFLICFEPVYYHFTATPDTQVWTYFHGTSANRLKAWGLWANANETSCIACLGIACALFLILTNRKKSTLATFAVMTLSVLMPVVFLSGSRAGLAALAILLLSQVFLVKSKKVKVLVTILVLVAVAVAPTLMPHRQDEEGSSSERFDLRYAGRQLFLQRPFLGWGFRQVQKETGGKVLHNTYIQAFAETGVVGGLTLIGYLYLVGKRIAIFWRNSRSNNDVQAQLVFGILLGTFISSLLYFYYGNQLLTTLFLTYMALLRRVASEYSLQTVAS